MTLLKISERRYFTKVFSIPLSGCPRAKISYFERERLVCVNFPNIGINLLDSQTSTKANTTNERQLTKIIFFTNHIFLQKLCHINDCLFATTLKINQGILSIMLCIWSCWKTFSDWKLYCEVWGRCGGEGGGGMENTLFVLYGHNYVLTWGILILWWEGK